MDSLERMREELEELRTKVDKLAAFNMSDKFKDLTMHEQVLLCLQASHMNLYEEVLAERVYLYESKVRG